MSLGKAKEYLHKNGLSIVVIRDDEILFTSMERGIKPIYTLYTEKRDLLKDSFVADKVIGRGAMMFWWLPMLKGFMVD